jgi:hypothetical protein
LQYNNAAAFGGTTAGTYQGSGALFTFAAQAAGDTPLVLKGSAAQSASLQEWRNSAGTALSRITKDGYLGLVASGYINFDTTDGASGYGLRDNAGDIEFKDAGGAWTALNSLSGGGGGGGSLPSLANGSIWIGNGSAVATARTLSGDITVTNTGVTAIGSGKVTNAMLAGSIAASKLVGTDIATVGTLTAGATGAGFTIALGTSSVTGRVGASNLPQVSGRSVWANSGNGTADVASLQSSAGGQILNSTASSIAWTETPILGAAGSDGRLDRLPERDLGHHCGAADHGRAGLRHADIAGHDGHLRAHRQQAQRFCRYDFGRTCRRHHG